MFGLSFANIFYVIARIFSTFAAPKGTLGLYYSSGNQATCDAQGFIVQLGMTQPLYTACLCVNYLLVIKYSKSEEYLAKYLEPYMHVVSVGYPLIGACICLKLRYFNNGPMGCWIGSYPMDCDIRDKSTCIRGQGYHVVLWAFSGTILATALIIVVSCMLATVLHVRNRMRVMNHRFSFGQSQISRSRNLDKQYRLVTKQALLYVGTFVMVWAFEYIFRIARQIRGKSTINLLIPEQVFNPMQGFFNFIIYLWPRYVKAKEESTDKSFWWLMQDSIITTTKTKTERRRSIDMNRRIIKKRMSIMRRLQLREDSRNQLTSESSETCFPVMDQSEQNEEGLSKNKDSDLHVTRHTWSSLDLYSDEGTETTL